MRSNLDWLCRYSPDECRARKAFKNWVEHEVIYPQGEAIEELPYPRAKACAVPAGRCGLSTVLRQ
jgi:hypothetical protein